MKKNLTKALLYPLLLIAILRGITPFIYAIIDDRSMMEILSGQYLGHPDPHAIFLGYWYSCILTGLYRISVHVDWYGLLFLLVQWGCMSLILYRVQGQTEDWSMQNRRVALTMVIFLLVGLQTVTQLTFTTTAAVVAATVLYWYVTSEKIEGKHFAVLFLLCFLTQQIRLEIFLMILPVCSLFWFIRLHRRGILGMRRWEICLPMVAVTVLGIAFLGNVVGYGSPEWKAYNQYNQYRSDIYDYPDYTFPPYEDAEDLYAAAGIDTKSRARTLINYDYVADDQITPDFFEQYIRVYQQIRPSGQTRMDRLVESMKSYVKGVLDGRFHITQSVGMVLLGILLLMCIGKRKWTQAVEMGLLIGIQIVLWIYLLYKGRVPARVIYSMNLLLVTIVVLAWRECLHSVGEQIPNAFKRKGMTLLMLVLLGVGALYAKEIRTQNLAISNRCEDVEKLKSFCAEHPENFYFNDVTTMAFTTWDVKLWRNETYTMNYMSLGDWMSFSPLWKEKLEQQGITSVREALYQWDNVYLICTFDKGLEYLTSLYENTTCTEVDHAGLFHIYKLQSL
ncbi:hypothetical protein KFE18_09350 [Clostridiaceae bacterium Marseille-Q4143]|nr:hypothetical protein KFE18_09350 [Clostridiaceae bacterium Marseille-Q4143]